MHLVVAVYLQKTLVIKAAFYSTVGVNVAMNNQGELVANRKQSQTIMSQMIAVENLVIYACMVQSTFQKYDKLNRTALRFRFSTKVKRTRIFLHDLHVHFRCKM